MTTLEFSGAYDYTVHYIESPVFMYSPAPIIIEAPDAPDGYLIALTVTNAATGNQYSETRAMHRGKAYFEISSILQHTKTWDISEFNPGNTCTCDEFSVKVIDVADEIHGGYVYLNFWAVYGALDQTERYFDNREKTPAHRRLWMNYPQTCSFQRDERDEYFLAISGETLYFPHSGDLPPVVEKDPLWVLRYFEDRGSTYASEVLRALKNGQPQMVGVSAYNRVDSEGNHYTYSHPHYIRFVPDFAPGDRGTFLRWLQRDGSVGYWWFENGDQTASVSEDINFQRVILGNPSELTKGVYPNAHNSDYSEKVSLILSTYVNNAEEFDYLLGLVTSPVVERLADPGNELWQRVNIVPGSYARSRKRSTPHRSSFEIAITLPQRNTIKL